MEHHFEVTIAKDYGIEEAIMLHYFYFWIARNAANEENYHEGLYWTYNTRGFYAEIFIYMSESKVYRVINRLIDEGLLVKGDYNTNRWKRPTWYALTLKGLEYLKEKGYDMTPFGDVLQNDTHVCSKMNNRDGENEQSINNYSNSNTNSNKEIEDTHISSPKKEPLDLSIVSDGMMPVVKTWLEYKKEKKQSYKPRGFSVFYKNLCKYSGDNPQTAMQIVETSMANNYDGIFPLRNNNGNYGTNRSNTEKFHDTIRSANEFSQKLHERVGNQAEMGNGDSDTLW